MCSMEWPWVSQDVLLLVVSRCNVKCFVISEIGNLRYSMHFILNIKRAPIDSS